MFNPNSTATSTKILPLVYLNGKPVVFSAGQYEIRLYEVISGPYVSQRGSINGLRELCGEVIVPNIYAAVSCETGDMLLNLGSGYRYVSELVV